MSQLDSVENNAAQEPVTDDREAIASAIAYGADVNARWFHNTTPLMLAVDRRKGQAVTELLARGADPNLKAADRSSAVTLAVQNYREQPDILLAVLEAGGDPNTRLSDNNPVIMRFLHDHSFEFINHMKNLGADLDIGTRTHYAIITEAAEAREWDVVWCLIELGAKYD